MARLHSASRKDRGRIVIFGSFGRKLRSVASSPSRRRSQMRPARTSTRPANLPFVLVGGYQQLRQDFAMYRGLVAAEEHAATPEDARP